MRFKKLIKLFEDGNVCVCGLRGRGKDLLMSNVAVRRKLPYISNIDYGGAYHPFNYDLLNCGGNTYKNFISGNVNYYKFGYPDSTDIYLSDAGIYFPSQYCNELNKLYPYMAVFQAISRHVGDCNFHFNSQNLNRVWDKIREQSDIYILCRRCFYVCGYVLQFVTVYDRYQSALDRQKPLRMSVPLFASADARYRVKIAKSQFEASHGTIKNRILFYKNKSTYDTRRFRAILEDGEKR